jgi:hypothetical protein
MHSIRNGITLSRRDRPNDSYDALIGGRLLNCEADNLRWCDQPPIQIVDLVRDLLRGRRVERWRSPLGGAGVRLTEELNGELAWIG